MVHATRGGADVRQGHQQPDIRASSSPNDGLRRVEFDQSDGSDDSGVPVGGLEEQEIRSWVEAHGLDPATSHMSAAGGTMGAGVKEVCIEKVPDICAPVGQTPDAHLTQFWRSLSRVPTSPKPHPKEGSAPAVVRLVSFEKPVVARLEEEERLSMCASPPSRQLQQADHLMLAAGAHRLSRMSRVRSLVGYESSVHRIDRMLLKRALRTHLASRSSPGRSSGDNSPAEPQPHTLSDIGPGGSRVSMVEWQERGSSHFHAPAGSMLSERRVAEDQPVGGEHVSEAEANGSHLSPSQLPRDLMNSIELSKLFLGRQVATGSFGRIFRGEYKKQEVAIKMLHMTASQEACHELAQQFENEVTLLSQMDHPNIVKFVGAHCRPPVRAVVMEYMRGGNVQEWLCGRRGVPIPTLQLVDMATDIARGMAYLHAHSIVHRDLKTENLLFASDGTIKVADFGEAIFLDQGRKCQGEIGTYRWMAPEVLSGKVYSHKVDVYSFGLVLWQLLTLRLPFEEMSGVQAAYAVVSQDVRPPVPLGCPPALEQLMTSSWTTNPKKRPEFVDVLIMLERMAAEVAEDDGVYEHCLKQKQGCC